MRRWWGEPGGPEAVAAEYGPALEGTDPTELWLALLDGLPVAFVQTYLVVNEPEYAALVGAEEGLAGLDLLVGEVALTGRGLGSAVIGRFTTEIVFAAAGTSACVADPDARNEASLRAFARAGYRRVRTFVDPGDGQRHVLLRRDRERGQIRQ